MIIKPSSTTSLHFTLRLADHSIADTTRNRATPPIVTLGDGTLSTAMEQELYGLQVGAKKTFTLAPEDGVGMPNPANLQWFARDRFPTDMLLETGLIVEFMQQGQSRPGIVRQLNDTHVYIDFNHPLAGKTLTVEVEIMAIID